MGVSVITDPRRTRAAWLSAGTMPGSHTSSSAETSGAPYTRSSRATVSASASASGRT